MAQPEPGCKVLLVSSDLMEFNREKIRNEMFSERLVIFQAGDEESCTRAVAGKRENPWHCVCPGPIHLFHIRKS